MKKILDRIIKVVVDLIGYEKKDGPFYKDDPIPVDPPITPKEEEK